MTDQEQMKALSERLEKVQGKQQFLQNLAWVLGALAVALGLGGSDLKSQLDSMEVDANILRNDLDSLERLHAELDKDLADRVSKILNPQVQGAVNTIVEQQEASVSVIRSQFVSSDQCIVLSDIQVCWGSIAAAPDPSSRHTASFAGEFGKSFAKPPVITASPAMKSSGHMVGIFKWSATEKEYSGRLNNTYSQPPVDLSGSITVSYIAIGEPKR